MTLTGSPAWQALAAEQKRLQHFDMRAAFRQDHKRAEKLQLSAANLFVDFSKNLLEPATIELLCNLAAQQGVPSWREKMFKGELINSFEKRAALHVALRAETGDDISLQGQSIIPIVQAELNRIAVFVEAIRNNPAITDIVHIGIGGQALGPKLVTKTLEALPRRLKARFVANVDGGEWRQVVTRCKPESTIVLVASKTFTTMETCMNAKLAKAWLQQALPNDTWRRHLAAATAHKAAAVEFGVPEVQIFTTWDWVGGRYGLWSATGLTIAAVYGMAVFRDLLSGARAMDQHFRTAALSQNLPVILAMIGVWYRNFWRLKADAVLPYSERLRLFPAHLQQLSMESNGKMVGWDGQQVVHETAPVMFGTAGTVGQHSYYQLLHQGTDVVPIDFIGVGHDPHNSAEQQMALHANLIGQAEALLQGQKSDDPSRVMTGNRPSTVILLPDLSAKNLGALLALYEHKVFVQGVIWGLNSFDQPGVELGKNLASAIQAELAGKSVGVHDASTAGLIARLRRSAGS